MPLLARDFPRTCPGNVMPPLRNHRRWWVTVTVLALVPPAEATGGEIPPAHKDHWAWKPPVRAPLPAVRDAAWCRNPLDVFILAKLEAAGLRPAPAAAPAELLRRASLDLIGLPPTPAEVEAFLRDP